MCKSTRGSSGFRPGSEPGIKVTYFELVTVKVGQRRRKPPAVDALLRRRSTGWSEVVDKGGRRISVADDGLRPCERERERAWGSDEVLP